MRARQERERFVDIAAQLVAGAGFTRIPAGHREPAADFLPGRFEPADIVALPAM